MFKEVFCIDEAKIEAENQKELLRAKQKESKKNLTLLEVLKRIVAYRRATKYKENGTRTLF